MREGAAGRGNGWIERVAAAALVATAAAALFAAVRLGAACSVSGADPAEELRARTERRIAAERSQIGPALTAASRGERAAARREAEAALAHLDGNSQLHLLLAGIYREAGASGAALREYRRAVELVRDYADRRSPQFIGAGLDSWLRELRPRLSGAALGDLNYLARALAGGCA